MHECIKEKGLLLILCVVFVINFLSMPKEVYKGDPMAIRDTTKNLISSFDISISAKDAAKWDQPGKYFFYNKERDIWSSKWGIGCTFIYLPPLLFQKFFFDKTDPEYEGESLTLILNLYNIVFALLIAFYLYMILSFFSSNQLSKFFYILIAFYSTFMWNYLRAQSTEIFQLFFFLAFFYHFLNFVYLRNKSKREAENSKAAKQLLISLLFILFISLIKIIYVLLIPITIFGVLLNDFLNSNIRSIKPFLKNTLANRAYYFKFLILPLTLISFCILAIQYYKFGSPFETGYGQWEDSGKTNFGGAIFSGLAGYLFDPQWSIFINFPVLLFSFLGIIKFYRKHFFETLFIFSIFIVFLLVNSKLPFWKGEWCYGPRFLLFMLPVITIPFLTLLDSLTLYLKKKIDFLILFLILATLLFSTVLQIYVNSLPFFIFYDVSGLFEPLEGGEVDKYFKGTHYGIINRDLAAFITKGTPFIGTTEVKSRYDQATLKEYDGYLRILVKSNYYWFPDKIIF